MRHLLLIHSQSEWVFSNVGICVVVLLCHTGRGCMTSPLWQVLWRLTPSFNSLGLAFWISSCDWILQSYYCWKQKKISVLSGHTLCCAVMQNTKEQITISEWKEKQKCLKLSGLFKYFEDYKPSSQNLFLSRLHFVCFLLLARFPSSYLKHFHKTRCEWWCYGTLFVSPLPFHVMGAVPSMSSFAEADWLCCASIPTETWPEEHFSCLVFGYLYLYYVVLPCLK